MKAIFADANIIGPVEALAQQMLPSRDQTLMVVPIKLVLQIQALIAGKIGALVEH